MLAALFADCNPVGGDVGAVWLAVAFSCSLPLPSFFRVSSKTGQ